MPKITPIGTGLGYVVLYGAASTLHVTYEEAKECMVKHNLNDDLLSPPTARRAFGRSIKATEREADNKFAREADDSADELTFVLFRQNHVRGSIDFKFHPDTVVKLDKVNKKLIAQGADKRIVEKKFEHFTENLIGDDLRHMARKAVEAMGGISLRGSENVRDTGGIYFVPRTYAEKLEALANVLEELEIGYLKTFGVIDGLVEQEAVFQSSTAHVEHELATIESALENITTRASSARRQRSRLVRQKELLQQYAELTNRESQSEYLQLKLDEAIKRADERIVELSPRKPARERKTSRRSR